jgi:hypothetical protein
MNLQPHNWTVDIVVFIDGMQTRIIVVDENGYNIRLAGQPTVCLVMEKGYYFEAYDWRWTKTDILRGTNLSPGAKILKEFFRK